MKNKVLFLASILSLSLLASCGEKPEPEGEDVTITDTAGREVTINTAKVKRVICVGAGALRMYTYAGDLSLLVGAEDIDRGVESANPFKEAARPYYDANKEYFSTLASVGIGGPANQKAYDKEKVIAARPDLIISELQGNELHAEIESLTGAKVVCVSTGSNNVFSDAVKNSLENISKILKNDKGSKVAAYIAQCKEELETVANAQSEHPSFYVGCIGRWGQQSILSTSPSYPAFNVNKVNNIVVGSDLTEGKIPDLEYLVTKNPSKIILDSAGISKFKAEYKASDAAYKNVISNIQAFANNETYLQMAFNVYETNLEIALANAYYVAKLAYPTAYESLDIATKTNEITNKFLGKEMYSDIASKPLSMGGYQKFNNFIDWLEE